MLLGLKVMFQQKLTMFCLLDKNCLFYLNNDKIKHFYSNHGLLYEYVLGPETREALFSLEQRYTKPKSTGNLVGCVF